MNLSSIPNKTLRLMQPEDIIMLGGRLEYRWVEICNGYMSNIVIKAPSLDVVRGYILSNMKSRKFPIHKSNIFDKYKDKTLDKWRVLYPTVGIEGLLVKLN